MRRKTDKPVEPDVSLLTGEQSMDSSPMDIEGANAVQQGTTGKNVARATAGIVPLHILRFVIGFLSQPLIAHNLGLSRTADVYAVSTDVLQRIWLIFEKVLNPAYMPCFIGALKEEGEERAWRFTSTAIMLTSLALVFMTALAYGFMPQIIYIYSHKSLDDPEKMALMVSTSRLLLTGLFFLGLSSLTYAILNGYKRFAAAASGDAFWKLGLFMGALMAFRTYGGRIDAIADQLKATGDEAVTTTQRATLTADLDALCQQALLMIVVGFLVGSFFKLFPHLLALGKKWKYFRPRIDLKDPLTKKMGLLAVPLMLGIVVSEARGIYLYRLADDPSIQIEAGRAALKWSRIIGDNLIQIFPYALSIGIFPFLAELAREKDKQPLTDALLMALRICVFTFAPIMAILIVLRFPLLRAVWESGNLSNEDTIIMSGPFIGFTIGLIAFSCEMMLNQTFYAMTRAWTPTIMGLAATVLWVTIATFGVNAGWGLAAIAASESIAKSFKCLLMWLWIRPHLGKVETPKLMLFVGKVVIGSLLAASVAAMIIGFIAPDPEATRFKLKMLLAVTVAGCSGMGAFFLVGAVLRLEEVSSLAGVAGKIKRKLAR